LIPVATTQLCAYYTYLDETGDNSSMTPKESSKISMTGWDGGYHVTEHVPDVKEL